jgi:anti-anti-sigma factor
LPADEFAIHQRRRDDGTVVVSVIGELDLFTCPRLREVLDGLAARKRAVVLELPAVKFMDSTGLNLLVQATREARRDGWSFAVGRDLSEAVSRLFDLASMHEHLPFDDAS